MIIVSHSHLLLYTECK